MGNGTTHISSSAPEPPGAADFALFIEFKKGEGSPQRVFQAADTMIRALQGLDHVLCQAIDTHIEPLMVLEEVESGSLKIWLRNVLQATDDQALAKLDWKNIVGDYLVKAKYVYIEWANNPSPGSSLVDLARKLRDVAASTNVRHLPAYAPPSVPALADTIRQIDSAKAYLIPGDKMKYVPALPAPRDPTVPALEPLEFNLSISWSPESLTALATKETQAFPDMRMNLIVKKPDYLGVSQWEFRHGTKPIAARIEDSDWLKKFQDRQIDVRPGDALRCLVTIEHGYGHDNELVSETYRVTKVEAVLENQLRQGDLLGGG